MALMAGMIIFPACFTYRMEVTSGPGLLFDTMANVFRNMEESDRGTVLLSDGGTRWAIRMVYG